MVAIATYGSPSMIGKYSEVVSRLKKDNPSLFSIHCVVYQSIVHRQHFAAKKLSVKLNHSSNIIIITVNKIKRCSLSERMFLKIM